MDPNGKSTLWAVRTSLERFRKMFLSKAFADIETVSKGLALAFDELSASRSNTLTTLWQRAMGPSNQSGFPEAG